MLNLAGPKVTALLSGACLLLGIAFGAGVTAWAYSGRLDAAKSKHEADVAKIMRQHAEAVRLATEEHALQIAAERAKEQALRADFDRLQAEAAEEKAHAKAEFDRVVADLRAGNRRLSVAVRSCSTAQAGDSGAGAAPAAGHQEARAELDPAAAERILGVARDGDDAIRDLNACVDAYEAVRKRINVQVDP